MRHCLTFSRVALFTATLAVSVGLSGSALAQSEKKPAAAGAKAPAADVGKAAAPDKKTKEAARKAYSDGEKAYKAGDFAGAYQGYVKANELIPSPQASYWVAKALDQQGKIEDAVKAYEGFLADPNAAKAGTEKITDSEARLGALRAQLVGEVTLITTPMGAAVVVDGKPETGETPISLKLTPGTHKISVSQNGFETSELQVEVKGGEKVEQRVDLVAKPPPPLPEPVVAAPPPAPLPPAPLPPPEKRSKLPAYITLGVAGAGAVVGTIFGVQALGAKSDFDTAPTTDNADKVERNALISDMAFGVALTLGVTGAVLLFTDDDSATAQKASVTKTSLRVAPFITPKSGGASARFTF